MSSDHQKQTTAHCSTRGHFENGAIIFKEDLKTNTTLTKPDSDLSWQHLLCRYLRQMLGFTVCWMQHPCSQIPITFWFTFIIGWVQYKWHRYSASKEMSLEERTDETLLWHYSLAMPSLPQICSSTDSYPAFWSSSHRSPGSVISLEIQILSLPQVANFSWQYHRLLWHQWICGKHIMCSPIKWKDTPFPQSLSLRLLRHLRCEPFRTQHTCSEGPRLPFFLD